MAMNPLRDALGQSGLRASRSDSPFRAEAESALSSFRAIGQDLRRRVEAGDITPKVARQQADEAASLFRDDLLRRCEGFSSAPRAFADRLVEAANARKRGPREHVAGEPPARDEPAPPPEPRRAAVDHAASPSSRAAAFVRPIHGGQPVPTLQSLVAFHDSALQAGDETALEWSRRQLESFRSRVVDPDDRPQD